MAAGNETKASVIPLRTTFESSVFDRFAMNPRTQNTERPPYNDVKELTKQIHQDPFDAQHFYNVPTVIINVS